MPLDCEEEFVCLGSVKDNKRTGLLWVMPELVYSGK